MNNNFIGCILSQKNTANECNKNKLFILHKRFKQAFPSLILLLCKFKNFLPALISHFSVGFVFA